jgi:hypothetical protein
MAVTDVYGVSAAETGDEALILLAVESRVFDRSSRL